MEPSSNMIPMLYIILYVFSTIPIDLDMEPRSDMMQMLCMLSTIPIDDNTSVNDTNRQQYLSMIHGTKEQYDANVIHTVNDTNRQ